MEWQMALLTILGSFFILLLSGMPVAFCFLIANLIGVFLFWGGTLGLTQFILSFRSSVATFTLLPLPLFVLMGEVMFHSGIGVLVMDTVDRWFGRLPGRLSLLAVVTSTILATMTGASMASIALLGSLLVPVMKERGYDNSMSIGPIVASGPLAIMIPPTALGVLLGAIAQISIGKILIAIIMPGLLIAALYIIYIFIRCWLQPRIAPAYNVPPTSIGEKIIPTIKYVIPVGFVIFMVIGLIALGVATPSEASATGTIAVLMLAILYGRMSWQVAKKSVSSSLQISVMMLMIIVGAIAFSQNLGISGCSRGLAELVIKLTFSPIIILILMQIVVLFLGCVMDPASIMMLTIPIYMPIINQLGFDPVWFAVIFLINIEVATISPPFGLTLFVMKGVVPGDVSIGDIYRAVLPFIAINLISMGIIIGYPIVALWLPNILQ